MAMTAWLANVSRSAICLAEKGWTSGPRVMTMTPSGVPSRSSGVASIVRMRDPACLDAGHGFRELRLGRHDVLDVDRPPVAHNPSAYGVATDGDGVSDRQWSAQRSMPRHQAQVLPFETEDRRIRRPAHPGGVLGDGLHDRLEIGRRARDHPQDLGRGRLLLQRLGQLGVPRLAAP